MALDGTALACCVNLDSGSLRWRVHNQLGAAGLPVEAWCEHAQTRLRSTAGVVESRVITAYEDNDFDDGPARFPSLGVDVIIDGPDDEVSAGLVERAVMDALGDAVGDEEVGWTAYDWIAEPYAAP